MVARKTITRCWLLKEAPTLNQCIHTINSSMECMTFSLGLHTEVREEYWSEWYSYRLMKSLTAQTTVNAIVKNFCGYHLIYLSDLMFNVIKNMMF